ncbi:type VI secretion system protein TssA [Burkholderia cepacia]|nr:type VI secretion system protein TssA [Burkholderia cepacia]
MFTMLGRIDIDPMKPEGAGIRDDARFDALQAELGKLTSPGAGAQVDWEAVVRLAADLLSNKGKDLLVGCYLAGALLYVGGVAGLQCGVAIVGDLVECHWDAMSPPLSRLRARRGALQWLLDRIEAVLETGSVVNGVAYPIELIEQLRSDSRRIDTLLADRDDDAPTMRAVRAFADRLPVESDSGETAEEGIVIADAEPEAEMSTRLTDGLPQVATAESEEPTASLASMSLGGEVNREHAIDDVAARLHCLATALSQADWTDVMSFRMRRFACWMNVQELPDTDTDNGRTRVAAPSAQVVEAANEIDLHGDPVDAVRFVEEQVQAFPFWLDLQRIAARALSRIGDAGVAARREVETTTHALLLRMPGLDAMKFADGSSFANDETREWLAGMTAPAEQDCAITPVIGEPDRAQDEDSDVFPDDAIVRARSYAVDGQLDYALRTIQDAIDHASSAEQRLWIRIRLCELVNEHWTYAISDAFARSVIEPIRRHELLVWNPELALDGLSVAYTLLIRCDRDSVDARSVFDDIVKFDAVKAMRLLR